MVYGSARGLCFFFSSFLLYIYIYCSGQDKGNSAYETTRGPGHSSLTQSVVVLSSLISLRNRLLSTLALFSLSLLSLVSRHSPRGIVLYFCLLLPAWWLSLCFRLVGWRVRSLGGGGGAAEGGGAVGWGLGVGLVVNTRYLCANCEYNLFCADSLLALVLCLSYVCIVRGYSIAAARVRVASEVYRGVCWSDLVFVVALCLRVGGSGVCVWVSGQGGVEGGIDVLRRGMFPNEALETVAQND